MNTYRCPVCGYAMPFAPEDNNICSCCGTEFGYDDLNKTHGELTRLWIAHGAKWFSSYVKPPRNWNPWLQLIEARLGIWIPWSAKASVSSKSSDVKSAKVAIYKADQDEVLVGWR